MIKRSPIFLCVVILLLLVKPCFGQQNPEAGLVLNSQEYLEMPGLNIMLAHDFYPEGHQGGVGIIQNGLRVATNGDLRLEATPGQWQPVPKVGKRVVNTTTQEVSVQMEYPDPDKDRKGFNPVIYPDLKFTYTIRVKPEGKSFRISIDLDKPLPEAWIGKVGFNLELFPGILFGKSYYLDGQMGIFSRQANGPGYRDAEKQYQIKPMASGKKLVIAPESEEQRMIIESAKGDTIQLIDGRAQHNNGWFVVRSLVAKGETKNAVEWIVSPHAIPDFKSEPVIQVSQVGYHPQQQKIAVIELDAKDKKRAPISLIKLGGDGVHKAMDITPKEWGKFLRYHYLQVDFTTVQEPGMYQITYGNYKSNPFQINDQVFKRHVWQPTLEYFLPAQMCHMRINDRYKVWHGLCHMDDARMAPINYNHFDGYLQGPSTLTSFQSGQTVPGLNIGAWHDAGDFDLRVESQADEIYILSLAYENFNVTYDNTTIDQNNRVVEIHQPDQKPDILQQIEHGALSIVGGYKSLGRLYRGIICPTLRQYVLLGDASVMTDNAFYKASPAANAIPVGLPGAADDRWVFTEDNPDREIEVAAGLAAASRALQGYNDALAKDCLTIAIALWDKTKEINKLHRVPVAAELLLATKEKKYADFLVSNAALLTSTIEQTGWAVGRVLPRIADKKFKTAITDAVRSYKQRIDEQEKETPYGVPYRPNIWGAGWGIQRFGVEQYFLHTSYPSIFPNTYLLQAMNFVLGVHPGSNTSSFASGVGSRSLTVAYGANRDDWSYIPGGVGSGTALIRPDFPELLEWPYLWQQTEYVMGGGASNFMFMVLAADHVLNKK